MGLGAYPASGKNWLGMLGSTAPTNQYGDARLRRHAVRRRTLRRPHHRPCRRVFADSKKIHIDIDPSRSTRTSASIFRSSAMRQRARRSAQCSRRKRKSRTSALWQDIAKWRARNSLSYKKNNDIILPQFAIQRLFEATRGRDVYVTTEVASTRCGRRSSSASRSRNR